MRPDEFTKIRFISDPVCHRCGVPQDYDAGPEAECAACIARPPRWGRARAAFVYDDVSRRPVLDLKRAGRRDGLEILAHWRRYGCNTPVLILTARDALPERLAGLNGGADDYLCKPFALDEVAVRLAVLVRRSQGRAAAILSYGSLSLDTAAKTATLQEKPLVLTQREYMLLELLLSQPTHIHSRAQIEDKLYGWSQEVESNAVEVHIHHLRKKIGSTFIQTQRGLGYRLGQQP